MSALTAQVLDVSRGRPAMAVVVRVEVHTNDGDWLELGRGQTDNDGWVRKLVDEAARPGAYRFVIETGAYFKAGLSDSIFPKIEVHVVVTDPSQHVHVCVLATPNSYTVFRS
jgi:hydroxyisourate hydrolase